MAAAEWLLAPIPDGSGEGVDSEATPCGTGRTFKIPFWPVGISHIRFFVLINDLLVGDEKIENSLEHSLKHFKKR